LDRASFLVNLQSKLAFWRRTKLQTPNFEQPRSEGPAGRGDGHVATEDPARTIDRETVDNAPDHPWIPEAIHQAEPSSHPEDEIPAGRGAFPWRSALALAMALIAQHWLNPPFQNVVMGSVFYGLAAALAVWAVLAGEIRLSPTPGQEVQNQAPVRWWILGLGVPLAIITYILFSRGIFTPIDLTAWLATLAIVCYAFYAPAATPWLRRAWATIRKTSWRPKITPWMLLVLLVAAGAVFFRAYRLADMPLEMFSDHAEKLLDIQDVLNGRLSVFFIRNSGREFFEFYLCAALIRLFNTGLTFMTMKLAMTIMGLFTLPFIYLLGKEMGNKRVALFAQALAAMAFWPNIVSRVGLRNTLYAAFYAPMLYFFFRGLRRSNRNDFIFAGLAMGIGLNGYTSYRIVPIVAVIALAIYLLHHHDAEDRKRAILGLATMAVIAFIVFIPLFRFTVEYPSFVFGRSLTRLTSLERPLPGPAGQIFISNFWAAITMFFWSDGVAWSGSVPLHPALDTVSAALFFIGVLFVGMRYWKRRNWIDLFMLISIPLLLLPSILALAFPVENPSLQRTMAAIVPVFLITAVGLDEIITSLVRRLAWPMGNVTAWCVALLLLSWSAWGNFDLAFNQFASQYQQAAWNTSEIGRVIRGFAASVGTLDSAYVIPYPYWVDDRLVGIEAGAVPIKDYSLPIDQIQGTKTETAAKLFVVNTHDNKAVESLRSIYPQGTLSTYHSATPGKDFLLYEVPPG
jgi:NADH:ubiquinone oxidoreductase subunit K